VVEVKPLRLKAQKSKKEASYSAFSKSPVRVLVDTGIFHLDGFYDYLVPAELDDQVQSGVRLLVPFGSRTVEAIAFERPSSSAEKSLKSIHSVISPFAVLNKEILNLILNSARRWAAHPYDLINAALPARVASVEKGFKASYSFESKTRKNPRRVYYQFSPGEDEFHSLSAMSIKASKSGGVLLLLPDERDVQSAIDSFARHYPQEAVIRLDSSLSRSERYANYLRVASGEKAIVVGNRSAAFAPVCNLQTIFIHRETSESFYEIRSPGWNARDISLMRSTDEEVSLVITGYSPSAEVARMIEHKWISVTSRKSKVLALSFQQQMGELLPNRIFPEIREALRNGTVLFMTPRKGYSSAMSCAKCRNEAHCECGGKLFKGSARSFPECSLCAKEYSQWKCIWCGADKPHLLGRGSERFAEELGRAFPGVPVIASEGNHILSEVSPRPSIVIATPGSAPNVDGGYFAVVILEADRYFSQIDMRAHERARAQIFHAASKVNSKGKVLIVIDSSHPITASIARWSPSILSMRDLKERQETNFPPYFRAIEISAQSSEAVFITNGFRKSLLEGRLPSSTRVLGPAITSSGNSRIILLVETNDAQKLVDFIHEFGRKRSLGKKSALKYRVDPYALT
jgi:primosomal protein N' (replication factor Y)